MSSGASIKRKFNGDDDLLPVSDYTYACIITITMGDYDYGSVITMSLQHSLPPLHSSLRFRRNNFPSSCSLNVVRKNRVNEEARFAGLPSSPEIDNGAD